MKNSIGIIGGMGPLATCDLYRKIIEKTSAKTDQEHIHVFIDSNTNIPDRTNAILNGGEDPVPEMVKSGIKLQAMGADVLAMPCNTAHYFYDRLLPFFDIPIINMLDETAKEIKKCGIKRIGLLATNGTIKSNVYHKALAAENIETVIPSEDLQRHVMDVIYKGIKASNMNIDLNGFYDAIDELFLKGAEILVLGCTELPLAFDIYNIEKPFIDPTSVLAEAIVKFAYKPNYAV